LKIIQAINERVYTVPGTYYDFAADLTGIGNKSVREIN